MILYNKGSGFNMSFELLIHKPEFVLRTITDTHDKILMKNRYSDAIVTVVDGVLEFDFDDITILCKKRKSVFVPKGSNYKISCQKKAQSRIVNFYTDGSISAPIEFREINERVYERIFNRLEILLQNKIENRNMIFSLYYRLFAELLDICEQENVPEIVRNAQKIMFENIFDSLLSCEAVSNKLNISEVYLRKLFTKHMGISPSKYLIKLRMERAKQYMLEGYSVTQTADSVGYSDIYQFSRAYKRYWGFSPSKTEFV